MTKINPGNEWNCSSFSGCDSYRNYITALIVSTRCILNKISKNHSLNNITISADAATVPNLTEQQWGSALLWFFVAKFGECCWGGSCKHNAIIDPVTARFQAVNSTTAHYDKTQRSVAGYAQWWCHGVSAGLSVSCLSSWRWRSTLHVRSLISLVSFLFLTSILETKCWYSVLFFTCVSFLWEASKTHFLINLHILLSKQLVKIVLKDYNKGGKAAEQVLNSDIHWIGPDTP